MDNFFTGNKTSFNYSRTYSKGKSFKFSVWNAKDTYNNDEFIQDFVQWNQKLWAAKKTSTNIPPIQGEYWELVVDGVSDVEFKQEDNRILWKYEDDLEWKDLFELASVSEDQIKKMLEDLDIKYRNTYDDTLSLTSTNAVQNQAVTKKFKELDDKNTRTDNELTNIKSSVNTALSNSKSYTDSKISETKIQIDSELDNLDSSLNSALTSAKSHINSEITKVDNKIKSEISRAQASETNLSNRIDGLEEDLTNALNEAKEYTDSEVKNNTNKINTLTGTGEGSVVKTVKDEIAKVVDGAPEQFNTLKEISEYLNSHEDVASGLVESITKLETEKLSVSDIDSSLSTESENPVMNKVITAEFESVHTELDSQNELIEDLQNTKIDKEADDYYPQLAVGLADNLAGVDVVDSEVNFRRSGGGAISDGVARIEAIKGNSVVWNQQYPDDWTYTMYGITSTAINGLISIEGTAETAIIQLQPFTANELNHKYLFVLSGTSSQMEGKRFQLHNRNAYSVISGGYAYLFHENTDVSKGRYFGLSGLSAGDVVSEHNIRVNQYDLTQMFGTGNEPTTIEEFYSRIPMGVDLNAYNEGEVIHMDVQSIESQGVNAWDEEWESGNYNVNTGKPTTGSYVRSKSDKPIKVLPNTEYYIHNGSAIGQTGIDYSSVIFFYDTDDNFIKRTSSIANKTFTTPQNCDHIRFYNNTKYGTTYKNDICINISDTSINGKYFPYIKRVEDLSIIRKYFPQGMKSAGSAHDEIRYNKATQKWEKVQRIGEVDMGTLKWGLYQGNFYSSFGAASDIKINSILLCSAYNGISPKGLDYSGEDKAIWSQTNASDKTIAVRDTTYTDVETFKAMLQEKQLKLYYELAEPIVTELDAEDQFKDLDYQVWNCGTEKAIAEGKSAPLAADITYGFNAIGKIKELESLVAALRAKVGI